MKIFSVLLIVFFWVFSLNLGNVLAHDTSYQFPQATEGQVAEALIRIVPIRFLPAHPLYFLITTKETLTRFLKPSNAQKAQFDSILLGKRLKEVYLSVEKGDIKGASKSLKRYGEQADKMTESLNAGAKNQDLTLLAQQIAEGLRNQETLFYAINQKWQKSPEGFSFDENFEEAVLRFVESVYAVDKIKPGLKDRFKTVTNQEGSILPTPTYPVPESL